MEKQTPIMLYAWLASLKKWTGKLVVKKKYMVWTGCLLLMLSAAWTFVVTYESVRAGKAEFKLQAEETLRDVGSLVVTERFESFHLPFSFSSNGGENLNRGRIVHTAKGLFNVKVDSLKEKQGLYSLKERVGAYAYFLMDLSVFPLNELQKDWQRKIHIPDVSSYLVLRYTPLGTDSVRVDSVGDASIARPSNRIGNYYVDGLYTTTLTAYASVDWKEYVDWDNQQIKKAFLSFLLAGIILFIGIFLHRQASSAALPVKREEFCWSIGKLVYHAESMELTCEGRKVDIQPQPLKLLCAFMQHGGYLSNADISEALGWDNSALGLDTRRKKTVSILRNFLQAQDADIQIKHEAGGYRILVIS